MSKSDVARLTGLSNSFVGGILNEGGNISLEKAEKVAKALHLDLWVMVLPPTQATRLIRAGKPKLTASILKDLSQGSSSEMPTG